VIDLTHFFSGTFFLELIQKGGPLMYPILFCSVLALAIALERSWSLRRGRVISPAIHSEITEYLREGNLKECMNLCRESSSPMTNITLAALANFNKGREEIREAIEDAGRHEVPHLERYLTWLSTIASVAPLLGLLGTVMGMIKVFNVISTQGPGNPNALAGGISEALLTTAAGLTVAIPSFVLYNYFVNKADKLIIEIEKNSLLLLEMMTDKPNSGGS
jgi:biopolymer transport protein ExbB